MVQRISSASLLLGLASLAAAQFGGPPGGYNGNDNNGNSNDPYSGGRDGGFGDGPPPKNAKLIITAHAICATVAFAILFPSGGIMIRILSFRGLWLVHGLFQILAYLVYIAAFAMGVWMATHINMMHNKHPVIGVICLLLLFLQPFLGFIHHFAFKKYSRRVFWSYAHIWIGRFVITLGIINGGLGLQLAQRINFNPPKQSYIIAYAVVAGVMWLLYVASAIFGEAKRRKSKYAAVSQEPPPYKREALGSREGAQYA
jgi:hypothetical protein